VATVQVRDLPEESYEVLRGRARRAGQSLQAYMRDQLIALAERPTKQEALEEIERLVARRTGPDPSVESIVEAVRAGRR
jgi:antitoxin FitA